ncbi:hypothetical protein Tco_0988089 [Tanacetum coccineum]|uniref:Uncharacterized protein n=1 Tax=Tanacetum coccineum TaxID=301880 RepID=A0ABQ5EQ16_9ASTR
MLEELSAEQPSHLPLQDHISLTFSPTPSPSPEPSPTQPSPTQPTPSQPSPTQLSPTQPADLLKTKKTYSSAYTKLILRVKKQLENHIKMEKQGNQLGLLYQMNITRHGKASDEVSTAGLKKGPVSEEVPTVSTAELSNKDLRSKECEEQRAQIARDEEIARQWDEEERKRAMDAAKSTKKIDWNDPSNIKPYGSRARKGKQKSPKKSPEKSPAKEKSPEKVVEEESETQEEWKEGVKEPIAKRKKTMREKNSHRVNPISTKFPIVDWKTCVLTETFMYYQVFRGDGSSKNYKILSEMLEDFDRMDVEELFRLVKERYSTSAPEGFDLMLWGDLHTLFEPDEDDEIWKDQHEYNLLSWRLCDFCGIHILLMDNGLAIKMLTEKNVDHHKAKNDDKDVEVTNTLQRKESIKAWDPTSVLEPVACEKLNPRSNGVVKFLQNNALAKLPMLKLGEYEMWEIRIKQYFQIQDYALWEVIKNGNSWVPIPVTTTETGPSTGLKMTVPSTAEEKICKKNDLQKLVSRLAILGVVTPPEDLNFKFWELYFGISAGANNDDKNLAFLTTSGASNTNNINTVNPEVSTGNTKVNITSTETSTASFSDATVYPFYPLNQHRVSTIIEDLEQLRDDDWKGKMDLKWKNGTTSTRWQESSSSKAVRIEDASEKEMCTIDGAGFDWSDMAEEEIQANMALMAFSDSEVTNDKSCLKNYEALKKQYDDLLVKLDDIGFKASIYKRGLEEYKQPEENTDDYIKQQQKTDSKLCKSPLRLVSYDEDDLRPTLSCPHMAPRAVLMKTGLKTVNTARPVNTVRSVNDSGRAFKYWKNQKEILMLYEIQQGQRAIGTKVGYTETKKDEKAGLSSETKQDLLLKDILKKKA